MPGNFADGVLERILDPAARRLRLETAEREADVFDCERNTHIDVNKSQDECFLAIYSRRRLAWKASGGRALST
jgi:hypothetical protein